MRAEMKKRIANLTSNVFNPFLVAMASILMVSFEETVSVSDAIKWSLIPTALGILPTFLFAIYLVRHKRLDSIFAGGRKQRTVIYILVVVLAGVICIVLLTLKAPIMLLALCVAGFSATVIYMCVNFRWKMSLHTASITAGVTLLFLVCSTLGMASVLLIPLVAWSRIELGHHSLAQVVISVLLGISILVAVLYLFRLI